MSVQARKTQISCLRQADLGHVVNDIQFLWHFSFLYPSNYQFADHHENGWMDSHIYNDLNDY